MRSWLQALFSGRQQRRQSGAELAWFRLRYHEPAGPTRCIKLLSRPAACGSVYLYGRPGEAVSQLYLGIPAAHTRLLQRMAADFGFSLKAEPVAAVIPPRGRLTAVTGLPWDRPFVGRVVAEALFVSLIGPPNGSGSLLPEPAAAAPPVWQLPDNPPPGLALRPTWADRPPPPPLVAAGEANRRWPLGWSTSGVPLSAPARLNVYGRQEAVADWLAQLAAQTIAHDAANLILIDGAGDLAPRLKRRTAVTRLLGKGLTYVDIDGAVLADGFNPLAAVPGESAAALLQRWQGWFRGMNVHPQGLQLLAQAQQAGVGDIPALRKWLQQTERRGQSTAVASLGLALNRLTASRSLRDWLEWPANRFDILPAGALLFACRGSSWARQQLLRAVWLAAGQATGARLLAHGLFDRSMPVADAGDREAIAISNGPLLPGGVVVLTECHAQGAAALADRFLGGNPQGRENLELLGRGEGLVLAGGDPLLVTWAGSQLEAARAGGKGP
jgi:hypothetical protein